MILDKESVKGFKWEILENKKVNKKDIPTDVKIPNKIIELLLSRGISSIQDYFSPSFKSLMPDPHYFKDMENAINNITDVILKGEKIAVFGDYDVDGATSSSIVARYMREIGIEHTIHIPHRIHEGYGPNIDALLKLKKEGYKTVIIVDSGSLAHEVLEKAHKNKINIIVLDHHMCEKPDLPKGIIVNPNRFDEDKKYHYLCAAGLSFLFLVGLNRKLREISFFKDKNINEPNIKEYLGIVALGTVCDVMKLVDLNRAYVAMGLPYLEKNLGINALVNVINKYKEEKANEEGKNFYALKPPFSAMDCGFNIGPCINAGGRIGDEANMGARLLYTDDEEEANEIAEKLVALNEERKIQEKIAVETSSEVVKEKYLNSNIIVVYDKKWHPGVIGIVASRLKDKFNKTTVVIGEGGKGSCRSVDGYNIGEAIIESVENKICKVGGGHAAAAGLTVDPKNVNKLRKFLDEKTKDFTSPPIKMDINFSIEELTPDLITSFEKMEPTGTGNHKPRIVIHHVKCVSSSVMKGLHYKLRLEDDNGFVMEAIAFNVADTPLGDAMATCEDKYVSITGDLYINSYGGKNRVEMKVSDMIVED